MHHTLIPTAERRRLHREYYMRVAVVSIVALSVAVLIGCVALFPPFIRALEDTHAAASAVTADTQQNVTDAALVGAKAELAGSATLVSTLATDDQQASFTDLVAQVVSVSDGIVVTGIDVTFNDPKSASVAVTGTAPTRDSLLAYRTRLESLFAGTKIDIPISDLAKSTQLGFNLRLAIKLP